MYHLLLNVLTCLQYAIEVLQARHLVVKGDSELVVKQMTGKYRVKTERLIPLYTEADELRQRCSSCQFQHVYR